MQTKAVTQRKMRAVIIKIMIDLTETLHVRYSLSLSDTTKLLVQTLCLAHNPMSLTLFHPFVLAFAGTFVQWPFFPKSELQQISVFPVICAHTGMCTPTHIRKLISTIGCEMLGAHSLLLSVQSDNCERRRERETLCDIRPWDRKSCREFDRINGH